MIDEACLAILGLLLAFCFATAYGKLDARNGRIVDDATALRTLYYRCQLLPEAHRERLLPLLDNAVASRVTILAKGPTAGDLQSLDAHLRGVESKILSIILEIGKDKLTADQTSSLLDACIGVIDSHEARVSALSDHVPVSVLALMILVASISSYLIGRAEAESGRLRRRTITLILIVSAIVQVTVDLEQPLRGFILSNHEPMIRLAESLGIKI